MIYGNFNSNTRRPRVHWLSITNFLLLISLLLLYLSNYGQVFKAGKENTRSILDGGNTGLPLYSPVDGTVAGVYFQEGGQVHAGDLLYEIDDTGVMKKIDSLKTEIEKLNSSQGKTAVKNEILDLKAPFSGFVSDITAQQGQFLEKGDPLFVLTDTTRMKLQVNFNSIDVQQMKVGQKARVSVWDFMTYVNGTVVYINSKPVYTPSGGEIYPVELEVENPIGILKGMSGSAEVTTPAGSVQSMDGGKFDYVRSTTVRADSALTVEQINLRQNQYVNQGEVLLKIRKDTVAQSTDKNSSRLVELQKQLGILQSQLSYRKVFAPADGIIRNMAVVPGDVVAKGTLMGNLYS